MNDGREAPTAGIFIPTMNRVDFAIRQLRYYASVQCPHTIYVGDSSQKEESERIDNEIKKLGNTIRAKYYHLPGYDSWRSHYFLITQVEEKYICYSGDDDYQIPASVTKCIEFLEAHPDYSSASGYSVTFRLKQSEKVYGELDHLSDYARRQIENETAAERIFNFFSNYYVTHFSVNKTQNVKSHWNIEPEINDNAFKSEILPTSLPLICGKSKILDCLGFVRQSRDGYYAQLQGVDWLANENWRESYLGFHNRLSKELAEKDGISIEEAGEIMTKAFWLYLQKNLTKYYHVKYGGIRDRGRPTLNKLRSKVVKTLPFLKLIYRRWFRRPREGTLDLHYKALEKSSPYYKDFKPVMDSFTGKLEI